jgi:hypothetical protein
MENQTTGDRSQYKSIADCEICARIPQKIAQEINAAIPNIIPPEVDRLLAVIEVEDDSTPAYCISITRLLKCPVCGTYYYYNHYDDDGQHFMDPTCDEISIRRYDPLTAMSFLERLTAGADNALPSSFGQLKKAFAEGTGPPTSRAAGSGQSEKDQAVQNELDELRSRYDELVTGLIDILLHRSLDGQIKAYAIESLYYHFLSQDDWGSLSAVLLKHADPVVRVSTARLVIEIATGDAPVIDLVHTTRNLRKSLEAEIAQKSHMDELVGVLLEAALSGVGTVLEYDQGFGSSKYYPTDIRYVALYGLVVAAGVKADLTYAIPALLGMLAPKQWLNKDICWVLRAYAENQTQGAQAVMSEIEKIDSLRKAALLKDAEVLRLIDVCNQQIKKASTAAK